MRLTSKGTLLQSWSTLYVSWSRVSRRDWKSLTFVALEGLKSKATSCCKLSMIQSYSWIGLISVRILAGLGTRTTLSFWVRFLVGKKISKVSNWAYAPPKLFNLHQYSSLYSRVPRFWNWNLLACKQLLWLIKFSMYCSHSSTRLKTWRNSKFLIILSMIRTLWRRSWQMKGVKN